jgi:homoserine kinase
MVDPAVRHAVQVPATTANLGPGYDAFGAALDVRVVVGTRAPDDGPRVVTHGQGADEVATGDDNLVWTSLLAACDHFGWDVPDVRLEVHNPVPLARGMGSSSAAIVGGLGLARLLAGADAGFAVTDRAVGDRALVDLATDIEGHADNVAPAIHGGMVAAATTDDGRRVVRTLPAPATTRPLLLVPEQRQLTSEARAVVPAGLDRADVVAQGARAGHVLAGLAGLWPVDPELAGDRLHEPARARAMPASGSLLAALRGAGHHAWLSGAGPAVAVAVPAARADAVAEAVAALPEAAGFDVRLLHWDRQGVRACSTGGCAVAGSPGCADCPLTRLA